MHVPYEGPGVIADWIGKKGHHLEYTRFYEKDPLPDASEVELLIIMGGPMNVFDFHIHPWMQEEIEWVGEFIRSGKPVLGICLGAQIVAAALGEEVYPGPEKEIGWYNLQFLPSLGEFRIFKDYVVHQAQRKSRDQSNNSGHTSHTKPGNDEDLKRHQQKPQRQQGEFPPEVELVVKYAKTCAPGRDERKAL